MSMGTTVTLQETNDGELFIEIPDEMFDTLGWDEGTELAWSVVGDSIRITKAVEEGLLQQSGMAGGVPSLSGGDAAVQQGDGDLVGEPSF